MSNTVMMKYIHEMKAQNQAMMDLLRKNTNIEENELNKFVAIPTPIFTRPVGRPPKNRMWDIKQGKYVADMKKRPVGRPPKNQVWDIEQGKYVGKHYEKQTIKSSRPVGRPPKNAIWSSPEMQYLIDGLPVRKPEQNTSKPFPRPRGRAKRGYKWDYDIGDWVLIDKRNTSDLHGFTEAFAVLEEPFGRGEEDIVENTEFDGDIAEPIDNNTRKRKTEIIFKRNPKRQCKRTERLIEMMD
jgi:hypothetical protein